MNTETPQEFSPKRKPRIAGKALIALLLIFLLLQFFQPKKDNQSMDMRNDISTVIETPDSIKNRLRRSCYDCHSNFTNYPWYSNIQPVGMLIDHHIKEAKENINFQEFAIAQATGRYETPAAYQRHQLEEVIESLRKKKMPLDAYTWIHTDAKLTDADRQQLIAWAENGITQLTPNK